MMSSPVDDDNGKQLSLFLAADRTVGTNHVLHNGFCEGTSPVDGQPLLANNGYAAREYDDGRRTGG